MKTEVNKLPNKLYRQNLIKEEIIFIDGLSRAGKFLLSKLVSNQEKIEYFQYQLLLEHLPLFSYMNLMERQNLVSLFRLYLNNYVYER